VEIRRRLAACEKKAGRRQTLGYPADVVLCTASLSHQRAEIVRGLPAYFVLFSIFRPFTTYLRPCNGTALVHRVVPRKALKPHSGEGNRGKKPRVDRSPRLFGSFEALANGSADLNREAPAPGRTRFEKD
jgi:hypothetical protein